MRFRHPSRREFVLRTASALAAVNASVLPRQQPPLTALALIERIRANLGGPWRDKTTDGFKAGSAEIALTGVATVVMPTVDVLRRAVAARTNMLIVQEPTFYTPTDDAGNRASDAVYLAKKAFIDERKLAVWRFGDHWSTRQPSPAVAALADALGWTAYATPGSDALYTIPETTLQGLIERLRGRLQIRGGIRTLGRPGMRVRTVALSPATDLPSTVARLPRADVIIAGEPREWEAVPYVLDARTAGQDKAMVALGRIVSLEPGARACAAWIRSFTPEVPIEHFPTADPYWTPSR